DQIESAQIVYNGGQDLLKLINGILDLSKIEAGKMSLVIQTVHLRDFAHTLQSNFKPIAHKKSLAFHIKFAQDLPVNIETDDQRLAQVITNLLSNAFKFTKTGGITLEFQRRDTKLVISVNDTGIGIPKDKQAIIFEAFQQVDGSISRQYGGTGLGLSISKELAQLLGGTLHCHSVEHEGATFTLIFPLKIPKNQEPLNTPEKKELVPLKDKINIVFKNKKILIVDDDMRTLFLLSGVFQKHGLQVYKVANGQKALEVLENEHAIDVVIMDIMMPVLDGYKTLQAIRSQERFKNLPVILVTAKASKEEQAKGLAAGANEYLIKPVNVQTLLSLLQLYLYP
ncbi:MAG: response regulator, partial [Thiomargarita sp.]|nr:response regulator [Thiomargarita sp.]